MCEEQREERMVVLRVYPPIVAVVPGPSRTPGEKSLHNRFLQKRTQGQERHASVGLFCAGGMQ